MQSAFRYRRRPETMIRSIRRHPKNPLWCDKTRHVASRIAWNFSVREEVLKFLSFTFHAHRLEPVSGLPRSNPYRQ